MAQDVKIIANVGYLKGLNGNGMLYAAKTEGGTYLFTIKHLENNVETFRYYRKSQIEAGYSGAEVILQSDLNMSLFTDAQSPEFVNDGNESFKIITTVTNGNDLPRLYNLEPAYTVKGDGIVTADIDKLKTVNGGGSAPPPASGDSGTGGGTGGTPKPAGALGGLIPSDFSAFFTNPIKFVQDNMMFFFVVLGFIYFVRRKEKKPLWLF